MSENAENDTAQIPDTTPVDDSIQRAFLAASTQREFTFNAKVNDKDHELTIRRWSLREQLTLGAVLGRVMNSVNRVASMAVVANKSGIAGNGGLDEASVLTEVFAAHVDDILKLCICAVKPNFNNDVVVATEFVEAMSADDCMQLLLLIMINNRVDEKAKKKFEQVNAEFGKAAARLAGR